MSLPKIVSEVTAKLTDLPAILGHVANIVEQLNDLAEQQDRIEAKLDELLAAPPQPSATPKAAKENKK